MQKRRETWEESCFTLWVWNKVKLVCEQALHTWRTKRPAKEKESSSFLSPPLALVFFFRVQLSSDFSRLPQMDSLLAGLPL